MLKHKVSQEDILRNKVNVQTKDLAFDLATSIHHHLTIVMTFFAFFLFVEFSKFAIY